MKAKSNIYIYIHLHEARFVGSLTDAAPGKCCLKYV